MVSKSPRNGAKAHTIFQYFSTPGWNPGQTGQWVKTHLSSISRMRIHEKNITEKPCRKPARQALPHTCIPAGCRFLRKHNSVFRKIVGWSDPKAYGKSITASFWKSASSRFILQRDESHASRFSASLCLSLYLCVITLPTCFSKTQPWYPKKQSQYQSLQLTA